MNLAMSPAMNPITPVAPAPVTSASLIDDVMETLMRGERKMFDDLARTVWDPAATLAALAGSDCDRQMRGVGGAS